MEDVKIEKKLVLKKQVKLFFSKVLICIIILLMSLIITKKNPSTRKYIKENIYEKNFKLAKLHELYDKYFGSILPLSKIVNNEQPVFNEKLNYKDDKEYKEGVELTVVNNYMIPALESGIIVFIGEKEDYGKTIIVDQVDGIEVFYSNVNTDSIKLYDYVEKGELLTETLTDKLYLVFYKDGEYINYKKVI